MLLRYLASGFIYYTNVNAIVHVGYRRANPISVLEITTSTFLQTKTVTKTITTGDDSPLTASISNTPLPLPGSEARNEEAVLVVPQFQVQTSSYSFSSPSNSPSPTASANSSIQSESISPKQEILAAAPDIIPIIVGSPTEVESDLPILPIVAVYYPDYAADSLAPEALDFDRIDWVDFAFGIPVPETGGLKFSQENSEQLLARIVTAAHAKGKSVKLSIGGWSDSGAFSPIMASSALRQAFVSSILSIYSQHQLDGIDIDWEYPGQAGNNNPTSPSDTANFLSFLQLLRSALPPNAKISAAVQDFPFASQTGAPITDASEFAKVLDWVLLMNYDVWSGASAGPGGGTGSNAPLNNTCGNSTQPTQNARAAVQSWTGANFPASKLLLGVPSYGHVAQTSSNSLLARGDRFRFRRQVVVMTAPQPVVLKTDTDGSVQFTDLIAQGALVNNASSDDYEGGGGFTRHWDICSSTPYLYSQSAAQIVSYDDPESVRLKAEFVLQQGLLGINLFDAHGDSRGWDLIDAGRRGLGLAS